MAGGRDERMTTDRRAAIIGCGSALGNTVRTNDDPIFGYIHDHPPPNENLFDGLKYRRVLADGQTVASISAEAAQMALDEANLLAEDVDALIGSVSTGLYSAPNGLAAVHAELGLSSRCRIMALNTEYTIFQDGLKWAHDLLENGTIDKALVVAGNDWTQHVDYHEAVSVAASDAAGAAVLGCAPDPECFTLVDWDNETDSRLYGAFRMAPRTIPTPPTYSGPYHFFTTQLMKLDDKTGAEAFKTFGLPVPPQVVNRMLAKHGLSGSDITLISHQSSKLVHEHWNAAIKPAHYVSTLTELADMVSASIPVNLAKCREEIKTDYLVLMGIGMEMHATAMLYKRGS